MIENYDMKFYAVKGSHNSQIIFSEFPKMLSIFVMTELEHVW